MSAAAAGRKPIIAGNWKMNYGPSEARTFAQQLLEPLAHFRSVERVLCPPAISIEAVRAVVGGSGILVGGASLKPEFIEIVRLMAQAKGLA